MYKFDVRYEVHIIHSSRRHSLIHLCDYNNIIIKQFIKIIYKKIYRALKWHSFFTIYNYRFG